MRRCDAVVYVLLCVGAAGCGGDQPPASPVGPSPTTTPAASFGSRPVVPIQRGFVTDSAFSPLEGVRVEVLDGPQAGQTMVSDAEGQFLLTGDFVFENTFRASKDGYVAVVQGFSPIPPGGGVPYLYFTLETTGGHVNIAGEYTLSFVADSSCTDLPSDLRTRTYSAIIAPGLSARSPANTFYELTVSGGSFLNGYDRFEIGVAGDRLGFSLHGGHDAPIVEQPGANRYLAYSGWGQASVGSGPISTISVPFDGWIQYCEQAAAPRVGFNFCDVDLRTGQPIPGNNIAYTFCASGHHQLILRRR